MATEQIKDEFLTSIKEMGLSDKPIMDENGDVVSEIKLEQMIDNNFWLPKLALKANEITQFLLNGSLFDVSFKLEPESACGFVIDEPDPVVKSQYGYPMFVATLGDGLKKQIIDYTTRKTLGVSNDGVSLINRPEMYKYEEGDTHIRPLEPESGLLVSLWHDRTIDVSKALELALDNPSELGIKP